MFGWPGWGIIFTLSPWNPTSSPRILAQARFMERDNGEAGFTRCVLSDLSLESLKGFCLKWCHPWLLTQFILCGDHACTIDDEFRSALTCPDDNFRKRLMFFLGLIVSVECTVCFWGFHHPDRHEFHRSIVFANLHGRSRKLRATKYRLICGFLWFSTKYIWRGENPGQWTNQLGDCFAAVGSTQTGRVPVGDELCRCFRWRMRDELLDIWIHPMQSHKHCMLFIYWDSVCIWNVCFPVSHVYISILGFKQDIRTHQLKLGLTPLWSLKFGSAQCCAVASGPCELGLWLSWRKLRLRHVQKAWRIGFRCCQTCFSATWKNGIVSLWISLSLHVFVYKMICTEHISYWRSCLKKTYLFIYNTYIDLQHMERLHPWNQLSKVVLGRLGGSLGSALGKTDALPLSLGWSPDSFWNQGCASVDLAWSLVEDFKGAITGS